MTNATQLTTTHLPYLDSAQLFELVADEPWALFLDSGPQNDADKGSASYDVIAISPQTTVVFDGEVTRFNTGGFAQKLYGEPLAILQAALPECTSDHNSAYLPGAYGYFSYDLARQYENLPEFASDDEQLPHMAMGIYSVILVIDHGLKKTKLIRLGDSATAIDIEQRWLELVITHQQLQIEREFELNDEQNELHGEVESGEASGTGAATNTLMGDDAKESLTWPQYQIAFERVREYIKQGDCYQVNLTKRFSARVNADAWQAYKSLREASPAPYGCYMNLPFAQILSNSPESFIQCRERNVTTSPIKGTRPRDHSSPEADKAIAKSLLASAKDRAENVMIVDLMRNDLSRACELGSVSVPELFSLHSFANVHHLISKVTGTLKRELHSLDLLRFCFPGGSITGAPKIRAMEIIEELEPHRRGLYCGAIGYIGADGSLETNIAIRTIVVKDGVARFSAGGGLVIGSDVGAEYQELIDKASMMTKAVMADN